MIETEFIRTDITYHNVLNAQSLAEKEDIYVTQILEPWAHMMQMVAPHTGANIKADRLAGARAWKWLLPEQFETEPPTFTRLLEANAWETAAQALETAAEAIAPYSDRIPFDRVEGWLVLADPEKSDPVMRGYTGGIDFFQPRLIAQFDTPNEYNIPRISGLVAHEFHHLVRMRVFPWDMMNTTVTDYIIHEGMAESFAAALFGEETIGYFVTEFDESQIETARQIVGEGLQATGFDILRSYIFGDYWAEKLNLPKVGMPTYGGYAIGYRVVQAYLERTGQSILDATFVPANDIVKQSGYFV